MQITTNFENQLKTSCLKTINELTKESNTTDGFGKPLASVTENVNCQLSRAKRRAKRFKATKNSSASQASSSGLPMMSLDFLDSGGQKESPHTSQVK